MPTIIDIQFKKEGIWLRVINFQANIQPFETKPLQLNLNFKLKTMN